MERGALTNLVGIFAIFSISCSNMRSECSVIEKPDRGSAGSDGLLEKYIYDNDLQLEDAKSVEPRTLLKELSNDSLFFNDIFEDRERVLVFRFSELNCDVCVFSELKILKSFKKKLFDNVVFLSSFQDSRKLKLLLARFEVNYPIYLIGEKTVNLDVEELNFPYYFYLEKDLSVDRVFIPNKNNPLLTQKYLEIAKEMEFY